MRHLRYAVFIIFVAFNLAGCTDKVSTLSPTAPTTAISVSNGSALTGGGMSTANQDCGNPNDWEPDDSPLQACLNKGGHIVLASGGPGYIVNSQALMIRPGTSLASANLADRARIIAGRDLFDPILRAEGLSPGDSIKNIIFDGMVDEMAPDGPYRRHLGSCGAKSPGNVIVTGRNFVFDNNDSVKALCGSALGVYGENFLITNNNIVSNGRDKNSGVPGLPWADGMTVLYCGGGYIAHNKFEDNTDIDLVLGGGRKCVVELNTIVHKNKHAFAGLAIGNFDGDGQGDHTNSEYRGNKVYSTRPNVLSIGILVGSHPWSSRVDIKNAGRIVANTSYGNVMNFVVEGVYGGEIFGNTIRDPQGEDSLCGRRQANFTVFPPHSVGVEIQEGWTSMQIDDFSCSFQQSSADRSRVFQ
ncbi:MAG: hypothetical protein WD989_01670 [Candidatus Paceibacterota bacterium]